jgi:Na+-translocating ferredoxin:NAD+ oxidoreductase RNF subunit RnfB
MGAVKNQVGLGAPDRLAARYGGVPVIYVESEDDSYVFGECWFKDRLSLLEFRPASHQCSFSGCTAVIRAVADERKAGNAAWGIVDRDALMSKDMWPLVNETDDVAYENSRPFGAEVKALCCWEMESYLADGDALEQCRAEIKMQLARQSQDVYQELLGHCQALVPHAAINAVCHQHRVKGLPDGYTRRFATRADVDVGIQTEKLPNLPPQGAADYARHLSQVDAFDLPDAAPAVRIRALLRRVHGKAVLDRFSATHGINIDLKGLLANRIFEMERVPAEIAGFVDQIAASN